MKKLFLITMITFGLVRADSAQAQDVPVQHRHKLSAYEELVYRNVSMFHKNFDSRDFEKNGDLVADTLKVNSNGVMLEGRDAFVKRIARFVGPFPDIHIEDLVIVVDGNTAAVRYVMTGTHEGDYPTPYGVLHATHKKIRVDAAEFFTFNKDAKLVNLVTVTRGDQLVAELKAN